MSETVANLAQKNARNAMQRVEILERRQESTEKAIANLVQSIQEAFNRLEKEHQNALRIIDALVSVVGVEAVNAQMMTAAKKEDQDRTDQTKKLIADGLAEGKLKTVDVIGDKSLIAFHRTNADGTAMELGGYVTFNLTDLKEEFRKGLLGKGVGTKVVSSEPYNYEVIEIYESATESK